DRQQTGPHEQQRHPDEAGSRSATPHGYRLGGRQRDDPERAEHHQATRGHHTHRTPYDEGHDGRQEHDDPHRRATGPTGVEGEQLPHTRFGGGGPAHPVHHQSGTSDERGHPRQQQRQRQQHEHGQPACPPRQPLPPRGRHHERDHTHDRQQQVGERGERRQHRHTECRRHTPVHPAGTDRAVTDSHRPDQHERQQYVDHHDVETPRGHGRRRRRKQPVRDGEPRPDPTPDPDPPHGQICRQRGERYITEHQQRHERRRTA